MSPYYDRDGQPIDIERFYTLMEDVPYRIVAKDEVDTGGGTSVMVSTVWLGIDHRFLGNGPPAIFETMVFGLDETYRWLHSTEAEARAGHADVLAKVHAAVNTARARQPKGVSLTIRLELHP